MPSGYRPILRNEAGLTILETGVIKLRESKKIADRVLNGVPINDPDRAKRVATAIRHEIIHFFQAFTTAFVFAHCEEVRTLTAHTTKWLSDKNRDFEKLPELKDALTDIENELRVPTGCEPTGGVSALQLMEAAAVVESLKSLNPGISLKEILREISTNTDGDDTYTGALKIAEKSLGAEATVRLVPTLIFIALNTKRPGETYCTMLTRLSRLDPRKVASLVPDEIFDEFLQDRSGTLISTLAKGQRPSASPFWNDVGVSFGASGTPDVLHLVAANPSSILAKSNWGQQLNDSIARCMPSLAMYEDGTGSLMGLVQNWTQSQITALFQANEIMGVMYRIGLKRDYDVFCQHQDCPDRPSALCHMAYPPAPPPEGRWEECPFRLRFRDLTGEWPGDFARKCGIT